MIMYGTMVCFINLILKPIALSDTPDSEHILEIATFMCIKINSHCTKFFILRRKDLMRE